MSDSRNGATPINPRNGATSICEAGISLPRMNSRNCATLDLQAGVSLTSDCWCCWIFVFFATSLLRLPFPAYTVFECTPGAENATTNVVNKFVTKNQEPFSPIYLPSLCRSPSISTRLPIPVASIYIIEPNQQSLRYNAVSSCDSVSATTGGGGSVCPSECCLSFGSRSSSISTRLPMPVASIPIIH